MKNNIHYEVIMGSTAYGVSDDTSEMDIYGFTMPPKHILFPYSDGGHIFGFGKKPENFEQFQQHHIIDKGRGKEYDISIYNIVKFFNLCMENNPNMVDALFVPTRCVLHSTAIANHVRDNRKLFLSKRVWHKFKGYAFSQLHKMKNKWVKDFVNLCDAWNVPYDMPLKETLDRMKEQDATDEERTRMLLVINKIETGGKRSKRIPLIAKHGFDTKFAYHVVRLIDECQQILEEGDLDLTRSREHLKAIRRGEVPENDVIQYFDNKVLSLENSYNTSKLPYSPDEEAIRALLMECIESHYGNIENSGMEKDVIMMLSIAQENIDRAIRMI